jgi:hypothetical protein
MRFIHFLRKIRDLFYDNDTIPSIGISPGLEKYISSNVHITAFYTVFVHSTYIFIQ